MCRWYILCLYGCSWVILLTTCGCKTIVSTIEHTFGFTIETTTGFHLWYSTTRYNHRIISIELIYLRSTVGLICVVYKYTTVDVNAPYRRFKSILRCFLLLYMWYTPRIFSFVYIYMYMSTVFYTCIYTYISHPFLYVYVFIYWYIYLFFQGITYWPHTCSPRPARPPATSEQMFDLMHSKFSIRLKTLDD